MMSKGIFRIVGILMKSAENFEGFICMTLLGKPTRTFRSYSV